MIILGIVLIVLALIFKAVSWLLWVGIVLLVLGLVLGVVGMSGNTVGGRRHWW